MADHYQAAAHKKKISSDNNNNNNNMMRKNSNQTNATSNSNPSNSQRIILNDSNLNHHNHYASSTIAAASNNNDYGGGFNVHSALQYNSLISRSNTNNAILTPTNMSENGSMLLTKSNGEVLMMDENNMRSYKKQPQISMYHNNNSNANPDVSSPLMSNTNSFASNNKSQMREVKFNENAHLGSLRLPQVNSIDSKHEKKNVFYLNTQLVSN